VDRKNEKKGLVFKKGPKKNHSFKVRYLVVDRNGVRYYKKDYVKDKEVLGGFAIRDIQRINPTVLRVKPPPEAPKEWARELLFGVEVREGNGTREYIFCALSAADKKEWLRALEGNVAELEDSAVSSSPRSVLSPSSALMNDSSSSFTVPAGTRFSTLEDEELFEEYNNEICPGTMVIIINDFTPSDYTKELAVYTDEIYDVLEVLEDGGWLLVQKQGSDVMGNIPYDIYNSNINK
jgi:hypothetical protein